MHLVTVLEEMPVQETVDGIADLRGHGLPGRRRGRQPGPPPGPRREGARGRAQAGKVDTAAVAADLKRAGLDADDALVDGLLAEARDHAERRALEDEQHEVVAEPRTCRRTSCPG